LEDRVRRWENNIQVDLREIDFEDERWVFECGIWYIFTCEYGKEPSGSIKCGEFLG
jgi:hypothetical protein